MKTKQTNGFTGSPADKKQSENFTVNLPGKKDIPDQENITVPPLGKLANTTSSSDDVKDADNLDEQDEMVAEQLNANVTKDERKLLDDAARNVDSPDQAALEKAKPDQYDEDGEPLNEKTGLSGNDLDVPGSELDDENEKIGEEDEENNSYSLDDDHEDDNNTRQ